MKMQKQANNKTLKVVTFKIISLARVVAKDQARKKEKRANKQKLKKCAQTKTNN